MSFFRQLLLFLITALISFAFIGMLVVAHLVDHLTSREAAPLGVVLSLVT